MIKYIVFSLIIISSYGCIEEYHFPEQSTTDPRLILQCILQPDEPIQLRLGRFFNKSEHTISEYKVLVYENGQLYDVLIYLGDHIYGSSDSTLVPNADNYYEIELLKNDQSLFFSQQQHFPLAVEVKSSTLMDTIWPTSETSKQITLKGALILQKDQDIDYLGLKLTITKYRKADTSYFDTIPDTTFQEWNLIVIQNGIDCSSPTTYYPYSDYTLDLRCYQPSIEAINYIAPNFTTQDSTIAVIIDICNISPDIARYYKSQDQFFEGTEFFFAPQGEIKYNINTDSIVGLFSTVNCTQLKTKIR